MSSIRRESKATCASGLPVSVADEPYFAMISFFTSGVNAISGLLLVTATTVTGLIHGHSL
jgi:hypothetical protein